MSIHWIKFLGSSFVFSIVLLNFLSSAFSQEARRDREVAKQETINLLSARNSNARKELHATVQSLLKQSKSASLEDAQRIKEEAIGVLDGLLHDLQGDLKLNSEGGRDRANLRLRDATFEYAARFAAGRSREDAAQAIDLLLQFGKLFPEWPLSLEFKGDWVSQADETVYKKMGSGGIWGRWYNLDLEQSLPLLYAYQWISPELDEQTRTAIKTGVFDFLVKLTLRWPENFQNTNVYKIDGLIRFGLTLNEPLYIHHAVSLIRDMHYMGFFPDGFWREVTPAYHRQVARRLEREFPSLLAGYSDPSGFSHPDTGKRIDNLQLGEEFDHLHSTMRQAMEKITLPDGYLAALNDADPAYYKGEKRDTSSAYLLGASGFAILGSGTGPDQQQLFLNFAGTHNHEHLDMLNLHWYAFGRRLVDETRYRPLPGSGSSRDWSASTAAHNVVVIDEQNQNGRFSNKRSLGQDDRFRGHDDWGLRSSQGATRNNGRLLLFDGRQRDVQVTEAEGSAAYAPVASLYRRTLVKVDLGNGEGYVVDIFRVKGGSVHDYLLHGPLGEQYTASTTATMEPANQTLHQYIQVKEKGTPSLPWETRFTCDDGASVRSLFLAPSGVTLFFGEAPSMNRKGSATFVDVRNPSGESTFVVVHESFRRLPNIQKAVLLTPQNEENLILEVHLKDRVDTVLSNRDSGTSVAAVSSGGSAVKMTGRLAYIREVGGMPTASLMWDGRKLEFGAKQEINLSKAAYVGEIIGTTSRDLGAAENALITPDELPADGSLNGTVAHVDFGGELSWAYRIKSVERKGGRSLIYLEHEPGFELHDDGLAKLTFFPGWGIRGGIGLRIPNFISKGD